MDSDDELNVKPRSKHYNALRSDLIAALSAFDRAQDWADLIHDLQRVNRVLNKHQNSTFLPEKKLLAKRLAQCLTSSLPSGVHLKALETYHLVFSRIGGSKLAKDLPLYAAGLFPVFSYCATSLKPTLLQLYEKHFLPLGKSLAPIVDGFVLAVLPGLEDESSEFYGRSFKLLTAICKAVGDVGIFSRGLWRALLLAPEMRLTAAHYLRSKLAEGDSELREEMVSDMPLVSYAIGKALSDKNALVQRGVLDLLLGELALDSPFFVTNGSQHYDAAVTLVGGVFGALLRRDISLTKRVHSWLLGGKDGVKGVAYCRKHSQDFILAAIDNEILAATRHKERLSASVLTRPYKVASALLDREEILDCVGNQIALRILSYGQETITPEFDEYNREIRHAFSEVAQQLGTASILRELERLLLEDESSAQVDFQLLVFALSVLPMDDDVVRLQHLPALLKVAVSSLETTRVSNRQLDKAVFFCGKALAMLSTHQQKQQIIPELVSLMSECVESFAAFFVAWLAQTIDAAPIALRQDYRALSVAEEVGAEVLMAASRVENAEYISVAKEGCSFLMVAALSVFGGPDIVNSTLQAAAKCSTAMDVRMSLAGARAYAAVAGQWMSLANNLRSEEFLEQTMGVIRRAWRQLHPSLQTATPQSSQVFLFLQRQFPEQTKAVVADGILSSDASRRIRNLERFACLWNHSIEHHLMPRPSTEGLFLMLDALVDEEWGPKMLARSWLADALRSNAAAVLDAPLSLLLTAEARTVRPGHFFEGIYDAPRALYGFQVLRSILDSCSSSSLGKRAGTHMSSCDTEASLCFPSEKNNRTGIWALAATPPSALTVEALERTIGPPSSSTEGSSEGLEGNVELWPIFPLSNYMLTIAVTAMSYLRGKVPLKFDRGDGDPSQRSSFSSGPSKSLFESDEGDADFCSSGKSDNVVWMLAGLGFRPLKVLHVSVSGAAAECLASLLSSLPTPTRTSASVAHHLAKPFLSLLTNVTGRLDPVLQLHFIDIVESLILCDGPAYRTFSGERGIAKSDTFSSLTSPQGNITSTRESKTHNTVFLSSVEQQEVFLPWLLQEVSRVCSPGNEGEGLGSQEVLGLRQRWIRFISAIISHVGISLPSSTEGLLVVLIHLLSESNTIWRNKQLGFCDTDFSRLDDRVVLLKAIAVITTNVLWSFELALATKDLSNEAQPVINADTDTSSAVKVVSGGQGAGTSSARSAPSLTGTSPRKNSSSGDSSSNSESALHAATNGNDEPAQNRLGGASIGASVVINAINPLRMLDFMKDVFSGGHHDGTRRHVDPRRAAARVLVWFFSQIVSGAAEVWGPNADHASTGERGVSRTGNNLLHAGDAHSPRLSKDLPRERRHAQRRAVLCVMEPFFRLRPTDVIASIIAQFVPKYDESGILFEDEHGTSLSQIAVNIVHAIELTSPDVVMTSVVAIANQAMNWDSKGLAAADGKDNAEVRKTACESVKNLLGEEANQLFDLKSVGQVSFRDGSSALAGGSDGLVISDDSILTIPDSSSRRKELFCAGDYFAQHAPGDIEIACFRFLAAYFDASFAGNENQTVWHTFYELVREVSGSSTRKGTSVATLIALASFVSKCPVPFPDKRQRWEVVQVVGSMMGACSAMAAGTMDISNEPHVSNPKETKSRIAVYALRGMARAVPQLIATAYLEDKAHLSNVVSSALSPAVATLKRTSARAAAVKVVDSVSPRHTPKGPGDDRFMDDRRDELAVSAAADLMFEICRRDWGMKQARRELVVLLDDPNFFHGKRGGLMLQMTKIVHEVMSSGGATSLLTSIGTHAVTVSGGIPVLFSGRDSEAVLRARAVRRIAFCVFVAHPDHYATQLPYVLERLRDALRIADANLVIECLLCLRVLLLKTGPSTIAAFRATTLSEIFRITSQPAENVRATIAALQFLDLNTLLSPPDNAFERCFFFAEEMQTMNGGPCSVGEYQPLITRLARRETACPINDAASLRLKAGLTVFDGSPINNPDIDFIREYASVLSKRNASPDLATGQPQLKVISQELAREFIE